MDFINLYLSDEDFASTLYASGVDGRWRSGEAHQQVRAERRVRYQW